MNIDVDLLCTLFMLFTTAVLALTIVLRPRVFRTSEWPWWLRTSLLISFLIQFILVHATLTGVLKSQAIPIGLFPFCAVLWIAIFRVWMRREPTDRWLFHVPQVPESLRGKRSIR